MARIDAEPKVEGELRALAELFEFTLPIRSPCIRIGSGVEFDKFRPQRLTRAPAF